MAAISSIGAASLNVGASELLLTLKADLNKAQRELSSGRIDDPGLTLGYRTAEVLRIRVDDLRLSTTRDANALITGRLDVVQAGLSDVTEVAEGYSSALLTARDSENALLPVISTARSGISALNDRLNATHDGVFVFAGQNSDAPPTSDYFAEPPGAARQAVAAAFVAAFGMTQDDPAVATIPPAAMSAFLAGPFADLFADPAWGQNWSAASDDNMTSRISSSETIETSASANHTSVRKLTASMVMVADLGLDGMSAETRRVVLNAASAGASESLGDLARLRGEVGDRQARVTSASSRLDIQISFTKTELGKLEDVDAAEAATRAIGLLQRIEAAYSLTSRIMSLSLLNAI